MYGSVRGAESNLRSYRDTDRESPNRGAAYLTHLTQEFGSDRH
jgi:hypothetical protein